MQIADRVSRGMKKTSRLPVASSEIISAAGGHLLIPGM